MHLDDAHSDIREGLAEAQSGQEINSCPKVPAPSSPEAAAQRGWKADVGTCPSAVFTGGGGAERAEDKTCHGAGRGESR